jgi:hypothetical protein
VVRHKNYTLLHEKCILYVVCEKFNNILFGVVKAAKQHGPFSSAQQRLPYALTRPTVKSEKLPIRPGVPLTVVRYPIQEKVRGVSLYAKRLSRGSGAKLEPCLITP